MAAERQPLAQPPVAVVLLEAARPQAPRRPPVHLAEASLP